MTGDKGKVDILSGVNSLGACSEGLNYYLLGLILELTDVVGSGEANHCYDVGVTSSVGGRVSACPVRTGFGEGGSLGSGLVGSIAGSAGRTCLESVDSGVPGQGFADLVACAPSERDLLAFRDIGEDSGSFSISGGPQDIPSGLKVGIFGGTGSGVSFGSADVTSGSGCGGSRGSSCHNRGEVFHLNLMGLVVDRNFF